MIQQIGDLLMKYAKPDMDVSRLELYVPRQELDKYGLTIENGVIQNIQPRILIPDLEAKISELVNKERTSRGLSYLQHDDILYGVAKNHSKDIGRRGWGIDPNSGERNPHYNVDGENHGKRLEKVNYSNYKPSGDREECKTAENIFIIGLSESGSQRLTYSGNGFNRDIDIPVRVWIDADRLATEVVQGWMSSSGHRDNIMNPFFDKQGLGIFYGNDNNAYVTQLFS